MITSRRPLFLSLGFALPLVALISAGSAGASTLPHHHAKAHAHATHASSIHHHAKTHRTASALRSHTPKA